MVEELVIKVKHLQEEMAFQTQAVKNVEMEILKLDGHLRSLRGSVNRLKGPGFNLREEESINSQDPTNFLRKL